MAVISLQFSVGGSQFAVCSLAFHIWRLADLQLAVCSSRFSVGGRQFSIPSPFAILLNLPFLFALLSSLFCLLSSFSSHLSSLICLLSSVSSHLSSLFSLPLPTAYCVLPIAAHCCPSLRYSTVTLFARFLGLSTSEPLATPM